MPLWSRSRRGYAIERGFQSRKRLLNRVGASKDFDAAGVVQSDEQILRVMNELTLQAGNQMPVTRGGAPDAVAAMLARQLKSE